jgi:hypothetical protein
MSSVDGLTDSEALNKAIAAYFRAMRRQGFEDSQITQPSDRSDVFDDRVVLSNVKGYLATYDRRTKQIYVDDQPVAE